ncbi:response regulator [Chitinilyticum piscinae]|uniref:Response regulator n=1 Tax=Chitinilyticum piscinae TaxID=2866724 RepID=A0A8J7FKR7_9NEIS|nr:response regulator [Chitinilyticum piscinae]MBE9609827.1 response regulator [Chitinilyticum piscinae]
MADDLTQARVLVADDAPTVRQSVRMTLAGCGINRVDAASSIGETRRRLRNGQYDVVLCDYHFDEGMNGQELLEELRHSGELPLYTIWIMITAEAAYEKVVAVAEIGPDDYLIKPFTSQLLSTRLTIAWARKRFLKPIYDRINEGNLNEAINECLRLQKESSSFRNDLLRILTNLLLEAGRLDEAKKLFEDILTQKVVPWAKLGLAKTLNRMGQKSKAESTLQAAIVEHAQYVDAYEALASMYMAEGRLNEAMAIFDKCLALTPNNVSRLQKAGNLANMLGDSGKAKLLLGRAVTVGGNSCALSAETVLQLALAARREQSGGDAEKYLRMAQDIVRKDNTPANRAIGHIASALYTGKTDELAAVATQFGLPDFTLEIGVSFIMAADLLCPATIEGEQANPANPPYSWLAALARRFVTTKQISGMLESAANQRPAWHDFIQGIGQEIGELNNQGVKLMLNNQLGEALNLLMPAAETTHNTRLMLSATHASLKYLKAGMGEAPERKHLMHRADEFITRLQDSIEEGVRHTLRQDLDELLGGGSAKPLRDSANLPRASA